MGTVSSVANSFAQPTCKCCDDFTKYTLNGCRTECCCGFINCPQKEYDEKSDTSSLNELREEIYKLHHQIHNLETLIKKQNKLLIKIAKENDNVPLNLNEPNFHEYSSNESKSENLF
jgi:hypothetical protein